MGAKPSQARLKWVILKPTDIYLFIAGVRSAPVVDEDFIPQPGTRPLFRSENYEKYPLNISQLRSTNHRQAGQKDFCKNCLHFRNTVCQGRNGAF